MLKAASRQLWTCPSCLRQSQRRAASALATSASLSPSATHSSSTSRDDATLRQVFDSRAFWNEFSNTSKQNGITKSTGLVRNRYLARPEGFMEYAQRAMRKCSMLVKKTMSLDSVESYKGIVKILDRLSDLLCRVIDLCDFIRATHPDPQYQRAATMAYSAMFEYMNQLNTMTGLNDQLKKAMSIPEVFNSWSEEEKTVAKILLKDFTKSAIDLPEGDRQKFVDLSNDIANAGTEFTDTMTPQDCHVRFRASKLKGLSPVTIKNMSRFGIVTLPTTGPVAVTALSNIDDPDVRRDLYMANRTASRSTIGNLETMLLKRAELAELAGFDNYAYMALSDKMAKSPEAVNDFLLALKSDTQTIVQNEFRELLQMKSSDAHSGNFQNRINAWDKDYYVHRLMSGLYTRIRTPDILSSYFSIGTVFQGLSRLFKQVYGIRFIPQESAVGETWHDDVRRLNVLDDSDNLVAVVYCDLFARQGKSPNPAHFTLRCSRAISADEVSEFADEDHPFPNAVDAATEGMAYSVDMKHSTVHQLPTIALICDFDHPYSGTHDIPSLLPLRDVQTLFHEMGHALHSILGRTAFQNVAGTRCATDLAEVPSVLMEYFAFAPEVLGLWSRHYATDEPLPYSLVAERLKIERRMQGLETEGQIMMALLDQALHTRKWHEDRSIDSTAVYHQVYANASLLDPPGTAWQGFFGHLYGYGATYYSYLFARSVAGRIWKQVFAGGALSTNREAGEQFKQNMLSHGGSKDGWQCIADVLKQEKLADGDKEAMKMVGKWGVRGELEV